MYIFCMHICEFARIRENFHGQLASYTLPAYILNHCVCRILLKLSRDFPSLISHLTSDYQRILSDPVRRSFLVALSLNWGFWSVPTQRPQSLIRTCGHRNSDQSLTCGRRSTRFVNFIMCLIIELPLDITILVKAMIVWGASCDNMFLLWFFTLTTLYTVNLSNNSGCQPDPV